MNNATTPTLVVIVIQIGLGLAVFYANPRRTSNQCFLFLSLVISAWLGTLGLAFSANNSALAEFAIRQANATGVLYLFGLNLLRLSTSRPGENWRELFRHCRIWLITSVAVIVFCQTKTFLKGARMPTAVGAVPVPI